MKPQVIITAKCHAVVAETLTQQGFEVIDKSGIEYDELKLIINNASGLIITTKLKIDAAMIDAAKHLQWIGRLGSGMEHVDVAYAESKGIKCVSSGGVFLAGCDAESTDGQGAGKIAVARGDCRRAYQA